MAVTLSPTRLNQASTPRLRRFGARRSGRRPLSPAAELRMGEQWRARLGMLVAGLLTICSGVVLWQIVPH